MEEKSKGWLPVAGYIACYGLGFYGGCEQPETVRIAFLEFPKRPWRKRKRWSINERRFRSYVFPSSRRWKKCRRGQRRTHGGVQPVFWALCWSLGGCLGGERETARAHGGELGKWARPREPSPPLTAKPRHARSKIDDRHENASIGSHHCKVKKCNLVTLSSKQATVKFYCSARYPHYGNPSSPRLWQGRKDGATCWLPSNCGVSRSTEDAGKMAARTASEPARYGSRRCAESSAYDTSSHQRCLFPIFSHFSCNIASATTQLVQPHLSIVRARLADGGQ